MTRVFIHPFAGVLSAYGMGLADQAGLKEKAVEATLGQPGLEKELDVLARGARDELASQGVDGERIRVVRRDGSPAAGVQTAIRADPLFPGWDYAADHNRPRPTDTDGTTVVSLLYPGDYWVAVSGRGDVPTVRVTVGEGTETPALLRLP